MLEQQIHILISILAFSVLCIAGLQAVLLSVQEYALRHHRVHRLLQILPPLDVMEDLLFKILWVGFLLLSASLITGFLYLELQSQHEALQKIGAALGSWLIFAILLAGRYFYGWRSYTAIRWTLIGLTVLVLCYYGARLYLW